MEITMNTGCFLTNQGLEFLLSSSPDTFSANHLFFQQHRQDEDTHAYHGQHHGHDELWSSSITPRLSLWSTSCAPDPRLRLRGMLYRSCRAESSKRIILL